MSAQCCRLLSLLLCMLLGGAAHATDAFDANAKARATQHLSRAQAWSLQTDNAADIRAGLADLERRWDAARTERIDAAIQANVALSASLAAHAELSDIRRIVRHDRVVALSARGLVEEALALFAELEAEEAPPAYVQRAAGDAHMRLREPQAAAHRYQIAIEQMDDDSGPLVSLMYAQLEAEDFAGMMRTVERVSELDDRGLASRRLNVQALRFSDRLAPAQREARVLLESHPGDPGLSMDLAAVTAARGQPREAARLYSEVLVREPDNVNARIGLVEAIWATGDHVQVGLMIDELVRTAPEHPGVKRLSTAWAQSRRAELSSTTTMGLGRGIVAGNREWTHDTWLYSSPLSPGVRIFAHHHLARARIPDGTARHERVGTGVEITRRDWSAAIELGRALANARDTSASFRASWQANDHWSVRALHTNRSDDVPLKGRIRPSLSTAAHLHASQSLVGVAYRWHESRRAAIDVSHFRFNDGNRRNAVSASWFERLLSRPRNTVDLQLGAYTSRNSARDANYFNPKRDYAASVTLAADNLAWRHYSSRFNHRVALTLGSYRQKAIVSENGVLRNRDYGWKPYTDVRYEHEWQIDSDLNVRYAIGTQRFPYDGVHERKHYAQFQFNWRF